jgi:hypothetical protein
MIHLEKGSKSAMNLYFPLVSIIDHCSRTFLFVILIFLVVCIRIATRVLADARCNWYLLDINICSL